MAFYSTANSLLNDSRILMNEIFTTLLSGGSNAWFELIGEGHDINNLDIRKCFESTSVVDTLVGSDPTQKYRILFRLRKEVASTLDDKNYNLVEVYIGTSDQLKITGGDLSAKTNTFSIANGTPMYTIFNNNNRPSVFSEYSYRISLSDHGFAFATWPESKSDIFRNNFLLCIQRPVNPSDGTPKFDGMAPVFYLVHDVTSTVNYFNLGLVRNKDINQSTFYTITNNNLTLSPFLMYKISLDWSHSNVFDNNSHVIKFPFGISNDDGLYLEEMDLMCIVNASSFAAGQDINVTMYGESGPRVYKAAWGDINYGLIGGTVNESVPKIVAGGRIGILGALPA